MEIPMTKVNSDSKTKAKLCWLDRYFVYATHEAVISSLLDTLAGTDHLDVEGLTRLERTQFYMAELWVREISKNEVIVFGNNANKQSLMTRLIGSAVLPGSDKEIVTALLATLPYADVLDADVEAQCNRARSYMSELWARDISKSQFLKEIGWASEAQFALSMRFSNIINALLLLVGSIALIASVHRSLVVGLFGAAVFGVGWFRAWKKAKKNEKNGK
jgi:hypothetical protein